MILDISGHNLAIFRFLPRKCCWGRASWDFLNYSQSTVFIRVGWNLARWYKTSVRTIARSQIFRFSPGGAVNRSTACSIYPIELKLGMKVLDINLQNRFEQDVLGAGKGAQNFRIFCGQNLYMFPYVAVAEISISSIREMTAASVRRYFLKYYHTLLLYCEICLHVFKMASLAASNWHKPVSLIPCLSWTTASCVFTEVSCLRQFFPGK